MSLIRSVLATVAVLTVPLVAGSGLPATAAGPAADKSSLVAFYDFESVSPDGAVKDKAGRLDGYLERYDRAVDYVATPGPHGGKALTLDGLSSRSFVIVPDADALDVNHYTLAAWIRYLPDGQARLEVLEKAGSYWMNIRLDTGQLRAGGFYGDCVTSPLRKTWWFLDSTAVIAPDTWTHVASTYDGQYLRVYVNGEPSGQLLVPSAALGPVCRNVEPLALGAKYATLLGLNEAFWRGSLDEIAVFDEALDQEAISRLMTKNPKSLD